MELLVSIIVVSVGATAFLVSLVPKRHERGYVYLIGILTVVFGSLNTLFQYQGSEELKASVERVGAPVDWSASEAFIDVIAPDDKVRGSYTLTVKVIPPDHDALRGRTFPTKSSHALNAPDSFSEEDAERLFWLLADVDGRVALRSEYESGIFTYYYSGAYDTPLDRVEFRPRDQTHWPSPYPSLRDLEGKYLVARLAAQGVPQPVFAHLQLNLSTPRGPRTFLFGVPAGRERPDGTVVSLRGPVRYVGGQL